MGSWSSWPREPWKALCPVWAPCTPCARGSAASTSSCWSLPRSGAGVVVLGEAGEAGSAALGNQGSLYLQLEPLQMTWGMLAPPLGNTRLHVVKLLASALSANDAALTQELLALDVPNTMLVRDWTGLGA